MIFTLKKIKVTGQKAYFSRSSYTSPQELCALCHEVKAALCLGVTEETLGSHQDEGFTEGQENLSPQDVEIVGWGRAVGDLYEKHKYEYTGQAIVRK